LEFSGKTLRFAYIMGKEKKTSPAYPVNKYSGIAILEHDNYGHGVVLLCHYQK
jgi:hypothetical protein